MEKTGLDYENAPIGRLFSKIFFPTLWGMVFTALITKCLLNQSDAAHE